MDAVERQERQARAVSREVMEGSRVESESYFEAILIDGNPINHLLHFFIGVFTCGFWWLVWLFLGIAGGEKRYIVHTDELGFTKVEKNRRVLPAAVATGIAGIGSLLVLGALALSLSGGSSTPATATASTPTPPAPTPGRFFSPAEITQVYQTNRARAVLTFERGTVYIEGDVAEFGGTTIIYLAERFSRSGSVYDFSYMYETEAQRDARDWKVIRAHLPIEDVAKLDLGGSVQLRCSRLEADEYVTAGAELVCLEPELLGYSSSNTN